MTPAKLKKVIITILKYVALLLTSFIAVLPLVSCVITAFKTPEEYAGTSVMDLPNSWLYISAPYRESAATLTPTDTAGMSPNEIIACASTSTDSREK